MDTPDRIEGLRVGDNVAIRYASGNTVQYYSIINRDTLFYPDAHAALAAGATESYAEVTNLNPPTLQLYQMYSAMIDGNVRMYLKQPASTNRWGTNTSPAGGYLTDVLSAMGNKQIINIWIVKDYPPNVQLVNNTDVSITPNLMWFGWRYQLKALNQAPAICTTVNVGGLSE